MFTVVMANNYGNHRCHIEKNVPVEGRLQNGTEGLRI